MRINTPAKIRLPETRGVKDLIAQGVFSQIVLLLDETLRAVYRDIVNASVARADALPTAGADYLGKFYLKTNSGAADTFHICIYTDATQTYLWKQVTLT